MSTQTVYTTTQERKIVSGPVTVAIDCKTSGSAQVSVKMGDNWVEMRNVTQNDLIEISGKNIEFRVVPAGGAEFIIN